MTNLVTEKFTTKEGRDVRIRIDYSPGQFHVMISINNLLVSENNSVAHYMQEDQILPNITDEKNIKQINDKLISLNKLISETFKAAE